MSKTTINGKSFDVEATGPVVTIQRAGQAARRKGYVTATNSAATMLQARAVLCSQNIVISNEPANFSLIAEVSRNGSIGLHSRHDRWVL